MLEGRETVFYAEDMHLGMLFALQAGKVSERHAPYSTFKIPNLLIGLESGKMEGLEHRIEWDPQRRPRQEYWPAEWAEDQDLGTAFQRSSVWVFQDLALSIGSELYRGFLHHFGYGSEVVSEGSDDFWLDGTLSISCEEQVGFLRRLLIGQYELSPFQLERLRQAAKLREHNGFVLYGKTGAGPRESGDFSGPFEGWFVGWLERPEKEPVIFALFTTASSFGEIRDFRRKATEELLARMGVLPEDW